MSMCSKTLNTATNNRWKESEAKTEGGGERGGVKSKLFKTFYMKLFKYKHSFNVMFRNSGKRLDLYVRNFEFNVMSVRHANILSTVKFPIKTPGTWSNLHPCCNCFITVAVVSFHFYSVFCVYLSGYLYHSNQILILMYTKYAIAVPFGL